MGGKGCHRTCEICGLKERQCERGVLFAQFPLDETRCKAWLRAVGKEELVHLPIEKLHQIRFVCKNHFRRKDIKKKGNRLKKHAIPMLNLPATPLTDHQLTGFPQHIHKDRNVYAASAHSAPSTSRQGQIFQDTKETDNVPIPLSEGVPSTSRQGQIFRAIKETVHGTKKAKGLTQLDHNYCSDRLEGSPVQPSTSNSAMANTSLSDMLTNNQAIETKEDEQDTELSTDARSPLARMEETHRMWRSPHTDMFSINQKAHGEEDKQDTISTGVPSKQHHNSDWTEDSTDLTMYSDDEAVAEVFAESEIGNSEKHSQDEERMLHEGYTCNECGSSISGFRYTCVQCMDYDACAACEARGVHALHYMLRVPRPVPHCDLTLLLDVIRQKLPLNTHSQSSAPVTNSDGIKLEVEEVPDTMLDNCEIESEEYMSPLIWSDTEENDALLDEKISEKNPLEIEDNERTETETDTEPERRRTEPATKHVPTSRNSKLIPRDVTTRALTSPCKNINPPLGTCKKVRVIIPSAGRNDGSVFGMTHVIKKAKISKKSVELKQATVNVLRLSKEEIDAAINKR